MKKFASPALIFWLIITIIPIVGIVISLSDPQSFNQAQMEWREKVLVFGALAPIVFIIIQALQVVITPISHYSVGVVGGFIFGPYLGNITQLGWQNDRPYYRFLPRPLFWETDS